MWQYLNKGISTPIAISVLSILAIMVCIFIWWQYLGMEMEGGLSEMKIPEKENKIFLQGKCNDLVDLWANASREEKMEECKRMLNSYPFELKDQGFSPEECEAVEGKREECPTDLGTRLTCSYICEKCLLEGEKVNSDESCCSGLEVVCGETGECWCASKKGE